LDAASFDSVLETFHHLDVDMPCGNRDSGLSLRVEVMRLEGPLRADKVVFCIDPGTIRGVGATVVAIKENSRWYGLPRRVHHLYRQLRHRFQVAPLLHRNFFLCATVNFLDPERGITSAIRNERDPLAVR